MVVARWWQQWITGVGRCTVAEGVRRRPRNTNDREDRAIVEGKWPLRHQQRLLASSIQRRSSGLPGIQCHQEKP
ncbi:hypothetical protein TNCV_2865091 [Trichonephila clavipes]|nr:hypothetical protein TNCV_2865091 [Trichonephila clavipes]